MRGPRSTGSVGRASRPLAIGAFALLVALLAPASAARAQAGPPADPAQAEAQALFRRGVELGEQDRWAEALENFRRSSDIAVRPNTVFNIAFANYRLGRFGESIRSFDEYLGMTVGETSERRDEAVRLRGESVASLARIELAIEPPTARLLVDGEAHDSTGPTRTLALDPGRHVLRATADGYDEGMLTISVLAGEHGDRRITMLPRGVARVGDGTDRPGPSLLEDPVFWVIAGAIVVGAGVGIGVGVAVSSSGAPSYGGNTGVVLESLRF